MGLLSNIGEMAAGTLFGIGNAAINDKRQLKQQAKLQKMEIAGARELGDYNYAKQYEMWLKTNYPGQVEQMKKAGINPALLYGMGGGGGQTTGSGGGSVSGGQAPRGGGEIGQMMAIGLQAKLQEAQVENLKADSEVKRAEAENKRGLEREVGAAQIADLKQKVESSKAQQSLTEVETNIAQIKEHIAGKNQNDAIAIVKTELRRATAEMHMLERENEIGAELRNELTQAIRAQYIAPLLENELTKAKISLTTEQTTQIAKQLSLEWAKLDNAKEQTKISKELADFETGFGKQASGLGGVAVTILRTLRGK